jgi:2'-5' RNA ligase
VKSVTGNSGKYSDSIHMHESFKGFMAEANTGNYVSIGAVLPKELKDYIDSLEMSVEPIKESELHATLVYSKGTDISEEKIRKMLDAGKQEFSGTIKNVTKFDSQSDSDKCVIVLEVDSYDLEKIHKKLIKIGANHSYDEYRPHVSIVYDIPIKEAEAILEKLNSKMDSQEIKFSGFTVEPIRK